MSGKLLAQLEKQAGPRLNAVGRRIGAVGTGIRNVGRFMAGSHDTTAPLGIGSNSKPLGIGNYAKSILGPDIPGLDRPRPAPGPPGTMFGRAGQIAAAPVKAVGRDLRDTLRIGGDALRHVPGVGKYLGVNDGRTLGNLRQGLSSASRLIAGPVGGAIGAGIGLHGAINALPASLSNAFQNFGASPEEVARLEQHMQQVGPANITWDLGKMMVNPQDELSDTLGTAARRVVGSRAATDMLYTRTEGPNAGAFRALDWARFVRSPFGAVTTAIKDHVMNNGAPSLGIDPPRLGADGTSLAGAHDPKLRESLVAGLKEKLPAAMRSPNVMSSPALDFIKKIVPQDLAQGQAANFAAAQAQPTINNTAEQIAAKIPDFANIGTAGGLALGAGAGLGIYGLTNLLSKKRKKNRLLGALTALGIGGALGAGAGRLGGHWLSSQSTLPGWAGSTDWDGMARGAIKGRVDSVLQKGELPPEFAPQPAAAPAAAATPAAPAAPAAPAPAPTPLQTAVGNKVRTVGDSAVRNVAQDYVRDLYQLSPAELQVKYPGIPKLLQQLANGLEKQNSYTPYVATAIGVPTALGALISAYRAKQKSRLAEGARGGALGLGTGVGAVGGGLLGGAIGAGVGAMSALSNGKLTPTDPTAMNSIYNGLLAGGLTGAGAGGYAGYRTMSDLVQDEQ